MSIIHDARALLALIQPLTGTRAAGTALVRSAGATGSIPANAHAVPIVDGQVRPELLIKTVQNPTTDDHSWPVIQAGTPIPILSVLGGAGHNLGPGTVLRWLPAPDGIADSSSVVAPGLRGGAPNTSYVGVAEAKIFEQLQAAPAPGLDLFRAGIARYPALMLVWQGSEPDDGQREQPLGRRESRLGKGQTLQRQSWDLFVIVSRQESDPVRREQGLAIIDELREVMTDRQSVDGMPFSTIRPLSIHGSRRWLVGPSVYVYLMQFSTANVLKKREEREFSPWLTTRLDADTPDSPPFPIVDDKRFNMPQD